LRGLIKNSQTEVFKDGRKFLGLTNGFSPYVKQTRATFSFNVNKRLLFHKTQVLTYFFTSSSTFITSMAYSVSAWRLMLSVKNLSASSPPFFAGFIKYCCSFFVCFQSFTETELVASSLLCCSIFTFVLRVRILFYCSVCFSFLLPGKRRQYCFRLSFFSP